MVASAHTMYPMTCFKCTDYTAETCTVRTARAPSQLLKQFFAYLRQNELAVTLREIARIERTLLTIDWLLGADMQARPDRPEQGRGASRLEKSPGHWAPRRTGIALPRASTTA